jgi:hypothetical protein
MGYTFTQSLHTFALLINSTTSDRLVSCHENDENIGSQEVCLVVNAMQSRSIFVVPLNV